MGHIETYLGGTDHLFAGSYPFLALLTHPHNLFAF